MWDILAAIIGALIIIVVFVANIITGSNRELKPILVRPGGNKKKKRKVRFSSRVTEKKIDINGNENIRTIKINEQ